MTHVEEHRDWSSVAALRPAWDTLLRATPEANYFQSFDWLETYWRHYGERQSLRLLAVHEGSDCVGIVPLTVIRERSPFGAMRVLTYPLDYWGTFYGPIGPQPAAVLKAALDHVHRTRRGWDLLDLRFAPPDEIDPAQSTIAMRETGFAPQPSPTDSAVIVDLPATFDEYLATRTSKWRMNCRRWTRRLEEQGELRYIRYRPTGERLGDADPCWDLYDACEDVARRSWQGAAIDGTTISHESIRPYLRNAHATACRVGAADVNLLYLDDQPIAFFYGYHYRGHLYGLRTGYDASASQHGIGNILYMRVIEDSIARGDRTFDIGPGSFEAKRPFLSRIVPIRRLTYANPLSLRGLLWRAKRTCLGGETSSPTALVEPLQQQA